MDDSLDASNCSRILKALGEPVRLQVVEFLQSGPKTVSDIATVLELEIANVSHHLQVLLNAGVVISEKDGKFSYYSLAPDVLLPGAAFGPNRLEFGCCRLELGPAKAATAKAMKAAAKR